MRLHQMIFEVGETVVYPHHGAATITAVDTRTIKGVEKRYITLTVHQSDLAINLPIDNAELVGVRDVIDAAGVEAVFDVLRSDVEEEPSNWSRRYKANTEKMGSGSVYQGPPGSRLRARARAEVHRRGSLRHPRRRAERQRRRSRLAFRPFQRVAG
jgi:RNA polymerase-interacting CarD/CdnL/TRCF family regulator